MGGGYGSYNPEQLGGGGDDFGRTMPRGTFEGGPEEGRFGPQPAYPEDWRYGSQPAYHEEQFREGRIGRQPVYAEEDPRRSLYDPRSTSLPIPGISSGLLLSGMNYDFVPRGTPIMALAPPPSPLQQLVTPGDRNENTGPYAVGSPVRVVNLSSPSTQLYNGLVGDIVAVRSYSNNDGTNSLQFNVRCPLESTDHWWRLIIDKDEHREAPSPLASQAVMSNRSIVGPSMHRENMARFTETGEERMFPPFIMIDGLPSEKLEPLNYGPPRDPGARPAVSRPPIWGPPTQPVPPGYRPAPRGEMGPPGMGPPGMGPPGMGPPGSMGPPNSWRENAYGRM